MDIFLLYQYFAEKINLIILEQKYIKYLKIRVEENYIKLIKNLNVFDNLVCLELIDFDEEFVTYLKSIPIIKKLNYLILEYRHNLKPN